MCASRCCALQVITPPRSLTETVRCHRSDNVPPVARFCGVLDHLQHGEGTASPCCAYMEVTSGICALPTGDTQTERLELPPLVQPQWLDLRLSTVGCREIEAVNGSVPLQGQLECAYAC